MKKLQDILHNAEVTQIKGDTGISVFKLCLDSRDVSEGSLFTALTGTQVDGHQFIEQAVKNGARCIVCTELPEKLHDEVTYVQVTDSSEAIGRIASAFYDYPTENLHLVGITGTNGKTTIATLLYELFTQLGYSTGLISTIKYLIDKKQVTATHTTPDAISLNQLLSEMVEAGCTYAFMEVSSHAIDQKRIAGLNFRGAVFTNLTHDHL
ncbi:MAG: UDP-N-acetylmuramoyl-L-alanyl-D-glutamate--2,6-diaminopimelate ligase, partial [Bacteroidetes bacterium]